MDLTPPLAPSDPKSIRVGLPGPFDGFLARLAEEQAVFLASWTDANRTLDRSSGQVAKLASIQLRLTQEFLDAQRAIVRRRAETELAIAAIAADAANEANATLDAARFRAAVVVGTPPPPPVAAGPATLPPPGIVRAPLRPPHGFAAPTTNRPPCRTPSLLTSPPSAGPQEGPNVDHESLARLIDGVFEASEPDGVAARRELRELLDGWWQVENQEAQAAIDDANARAAMHVHMASIEAAELARFTPPTPTSTATPAIAPVHVPAPSASLPTPIATALDDTDHEHLDDVLAHLLDSLELTTPSPTPAIRTANASGVALLPEIEAQPVVGPTAEVPVPRLPDAPAAPADSLNDRTAAPEEAFDRFWSSRTGSGQRRWLFSQLLLPAVTVIAVLALVLAVVG